MRVEKSSMGVSEIVGTVLLLGITLALFSVVFLLVTSMFTVDNNVYAKIIGRIDGDEIILEHLGGETLDDSTIIKLFIGGEKKIIHINETYLKDLNGNGKWDIGEKIEYNNENLSGLQVEAYVIETKSDTAVFIGTLQRGNKKTSSVNLNTWVNQVSSYQINEKPLMLTATGEQTLNNVTLYYRYSPNNWTTGWFTLTFDDFEEGFGNYTDGGKDCHLYTDGTHAHQGNNAANIQDNSGISSSFYLTNGVDVDTLGYTTLTIDFWFIATSMENGEDFWVQYYDGNQWHTVADYDSGDEFINNQFYHEKIWVNETQYTFPTNMKIRFQCDADNDHDDVYIDQIYINASANSENDQNWQPWDNTSNPDSSYPWRWGFDFPNGTGYYEFYSVGRYNDLSENPPAEADERCRYAAEGG